MCEEESGQQNCMAPCTVMQDYLHRYATNEMVYTIQTGKTSNTIHYTKQFFTVRCTILSILINALVGRSWTLLRAVPYKVYSEHELEF